MRDLPRQIGFLDGWPDEVIEQVFGNFSMWTIWGSSKAICQWIHLLVGYNYSSNTAIEHSTYREATRSLGQRQREKDCEISTPQSIQSWTFDWACEVSLEAWIDRYETIDPVRLEEDGECGDWLHGTTFKLETIGLGMLTWSQELHVVAVVQSIKCESARGIDFQDLYPRHDCYCGWKLVTLLAPNPRQLWIEGTAYRVVYPSGTTAAVKRRWISRIVTVIAVVCMNAADSALNWICIGGILCLSAENIWMKDNIHRTKKSTMWPWQCQWYVFYIDCNSLLNERLERIFFCFRPQRMNVKVTVVLCIKIKEIITLWNDISSYILLCFRFYK